MQLLQRVRHKFSQVNMEYSWSHTKVSPATDQDTFPFPTQKNTVELTVLQKQTNALVAVRARIFDVNFFDTPEEDKCVKWTDNEHVLFGRIKDGGVEKREDDSKSSAAEQQKQRQFSCMRNWGFLSFPKELWWDTVKQCTISCQLFDRCRHLWDETLATQLLKEKSKNILCDVHV